MSEPNLDPEYHELRAADLLAEAEDAYPNCAHPNILYAAQAHATLALALRTRPATTTVTPPSITGVTGAGWIIGPVNNCEPVRQRRRLSDLWRPAIRGAS